MPNTLYYGDNLGVMREHLPDESVDLVYLDPPFNSNANYNVLFREKTGEESPAQIMAFTDTWDWTLESERTYENEIILNRDTPSSVKDMVSALRQFIGRNSMMAYLVMMTPRLVELRRVLKPTGSIYLHCDPTPRDTTSRCSWTACLAKSNSARRSFGSGPARTATQGRAANSTAAYMTQSSTTPRVATGRGIRFTHRTTKVT